MGSRNTIRQLDFAALVEDEQVAVFTEKVTISRTIRRSGNYYCDATNNNITLVLTEDAEKEGHIVIVKKKDSTGNVVRVQSAKGIDGCFDPVTLRLRQEVLKVQFFDGEWNIL